MQDLSLTRPSAALIMKMMKEVLVVRQCQLRVGPPTSSASGVSDATGGNEVHPEEDPFITEAANRIAALKSLSFLLLSFASYLVFTTHRCYIVAILSTQHAHHPESNLQ